MAKSDKGNHPPSSESNLRESARVWTSAKQFYEAAELIWGLGDIDHLNAFTSPLLVNYAFCAELSLKALKTRLVGPGTKSILGNKHSLSKLFSALEVSTQNQIKILFLDKAGEELEPLLERCSRYFIDARYIYEHANGSYDLSGIRTLAKGLLCAAFTFGLNQEAGGSVENIRLFVRNAP